jgi:bacillithiol system protein YtxJ
MATYQKLTSLAALEELLQASHQQPVLFFKHSNACPISSRALSEFEQYLQSAATTAVAHALIIVQTARAVSNRLAELTGVQHESPQAILVRAGRVVWHDSHFALKADKLAAVTANAHLASA